jgi:hypothetical protein
MRAADCGGPVFAPLAVLCEVAAIRLFVHITDNRPRLPTRHRPGRSLVTALKDGDFRALIFAH